MLLHITIYLYNKGPQQNQKTAEKSSFPFQSEEVYRPLGVKYQKSKWLGFHQVETYSQFG